ncbi:hypothetical protein OBBRIDRAFT_790683 [Obba rivulosa]|uniref:F-box domain-containing protein n=1 Tax=Obba rivulosa TaxID=1052685 RepID=A0A8E2DLV9_9APHY|nr:hypothetical protein OBBRIDRAFT_790683 [Obba rivulosa]
MSFQKSRLCTLPDNVLVHIAVELALIDPLGPPAGLVSILRVCRHVHHSLSLETNPGLYAQIFTLKFDRRAANRRIGAHAVHSPNLATQLRKCCIALKRIRSGDIFSEHLQDDLWTAYIMLLENDGKNAAQLLEYARVDVFVDRFIRARLWEDRHQYSGWPPETTVNALAIWICWMTMDEDRLMNMTPQQDDELRRLILPYVICIVRYPFFHSPDNHFDFPISPVFGSTSPIARITPHGFWPIYRDADAMRERIIHYGLHLDISSPLVALGARLLFLTVVQRTPWEALTAWPQDREEALLRGSREVDPTKADVAELNANWAMRLYDRGSWNWRSELTTEEGEREDDGVWRKGLKAKSAMWDNDWSRIVGCIDPTRLNPDKGSVYVPGILTGLWKGRSTESDIPILQEFLDSEAFPETYATVTPATRGHWPVYMWLREHHCVNPEIPIPPGGNEDEHEDGLCNAWFPPDTSFLESNGVMRIQSASTGLVSTYETHEEGRPNSHNESTCTVCVNTRLTEENEMLQRINMGRAAPSPTGSHENSSLSMSPRLLDQDAPHVCAEAALELEQVRAHMNRILGEGMDVDEILEDVMVSESDMDDSEERTGSSRCSSGSNESAVDAVCSGIQDIIVTGETLTRHGQAWGNFTYYGRVRPWDGLIAIVRQRNPPTNGDRAQNVHIFRGYIVGGANFVGSIRAWSHSASTITKEGPFVMTKV